MAHDFSDAHDRHWEDAELLRQHQRLANADHLYGLAAECGLKALMAALGLPMDEQGPVEPRYRRHIDELWDVYNAFCSERAGPRYALPASNPFDDWSVAQRYAARSSFDRTKLERHQEGALAVRRLIAQAKRDGRIR